MIIQKLPVLLLVGLITLGFSANAQLYPNEKWSYNENPSKDGWDNKRSKDFRKYLIDSTYITGLQIVQDGKIVFEYGDVLENSYIASCRKSVLAMIYGKYVMSGRIDINKTLSELDIDDVGGLLPIEKKATIRNLISARSGVYHAEAYPGGMGQFAPERGSKKPGSYWLYNNWDFNTAFHIFEQETGLDFYDEFENQLVEPLHMQDWDRTLQVKYGDTSLSKFTTYPIWLSTRDMSRIGLLMLRRGKWNNQQVIEESWIDEMITQKTSFEEVNTNIPVFRNSGVNFGYGYMWWLWEDTKDDRLLDAYSALGHWGQSITVYPEIDVVVTYKTKEIYKRENSGQVRLDVLKKAVEIYNYTNKAANKK